MGTDKKQFYSERIDTFEKAFFSSPETTGSDPYLKKISVAYLMLTCWHLVYQGSRCQFQFQTTIWIFKLNHNGEIQGKTFFASE